MQPRRGPAICSQAVPLTRVYFQRQRYSTRSTRFGTSMTVAQNRSYPTIQGPAKAGGRKGAKAGRVNSGGFSGSSRFKS
jgi:hypothetical protein